MPRACTWRYYGTFFIRIFRIALLQENCIARIKSADDQKNRIVSCEFSEIICFCLWLPCKCILSWWPLFTANYLCAFVIILTSPTAKQSKFKAWFRVKVLLSICLWTVTLMLVQRALCQGPSSLSYRISKDKPFSQQNIYENVKCYTQFVWL